ncbi:MAG: hypothetical protein O7G85_14565, partial [Planctomycetota bacterium]|nr:hypothetical protein [Planctomycetota bacterium]
MTTRTLQRKSRIRRSIIVALGVCLMALPAGGQCNFTCPPGAASEPEPCGQKINEGCNSASLIYTQVFCGTTVCGTIWAQNNDRDTDWYTFDVPDADGDGTAQINITVSAEFPAIFFVLNDDCANILAFAQGQVDNYET